MISLTFLDHGQYPTFDPVRCSYLPDIEAKYTKCYKVEFPADEHEDYMLLERVEDAFKTWQGIMKDEPITVVYNEPDVDDADDGQDAGVRFYY